METKMQSNEVIDVRIPALRFPGFPGKWEESRVGELVENVGGTALENFVNEKGGYKFISIGNYSTDGKYIDNGQRIILNDKTKTKLLKKGDLTMVLNDKTASGDIIGSTILINEDNKYIYNQRSERLICKDNLDPFFAWQILNSKRFRKGIVKIAQGGTQIYVNFPSVKKEKIIIPKINEQQKIAEFLGSVDEWIENLLVQKKSFESYKKGMMQKIFSQEIRFKDKSGKNFPEWEEKKMKDIFIFKQGVQASVENQLAENVSGSVRFIRIIDITRSTETPRFIKDPGNIYHVKREDLFMVRYGTPGLVSMGYEGVIANNLFRLIPRNISQLNTRFYFYKFKQLEKKILELSGSTSMPAISFSTLNNIKIPILVLLEQQRIVDFLTSIDKLIESKQQQITQAEQWKKGLMQQMFV